MTRLLPMLLVAALCASCASCAGSPEERGRADAESAIAGGRPRILYLGGPGLRESALDSATGLFRSPLGCHEDAETRAYMKAHNERLVEAFAAGRLAGMHFHDRVLAPGQAAARFAKDEGRTLSPGGPALASPDGRFRVEAETDPEDRGTTVRLVVVEAGSGKRTPVKGFHIPDPGTRFLFEHDGRTLLLHDSRAGEYQTLDLGTGQWLERFPER